MQQQAVLAAAAAHSNIGPLGMYFSYRQMLKPAQKPYCCAGTIPDDAPFDASEQCSSSASASSSGSTQYAVSSWKDYFDSMTEVEHSGMQAFPPWHSLGLLCDLLPGHILAYMAMQLAYNLSYKTSLPNKCTCYVGSTKQAVKVLLFSAYMVAAILA